jgi:hypothetical protein
MILLLVATLQLELVCARSAQGRDAEVCLSLRQVALEILFWEEEEVFLAEEEWRVERTDLQQL